MSVTTDLVRMRLEDHEFEVSWAYTLITASLVYCGKSCLENNHFSELHKHLNIPTALA